MSISAPAAAAAASVAPTTFPFRKQHHIELAKERGIYFLCIGSERTKETNMAVKVTYFVYDNLNQQHRPQNVTISCELSGALYSRGIVTDPSDGTAKAITANLQNWLVGCVKIDYQKRQNQAAMDAEIAMAVADANTVDMASEADIAIAEVEAVAKAAFDATEASRSVSRFGALAAAGAGAASATAAQATGSLWPFLGRNVTEGHDGSSIYFTCKKLLECNNYHSSTLITVFYQAFKGQGGFENTIFIETRENFSSIFKVDAQGNLFMTTAFQTRLAELVKADYRKVQTQVMERVNATAAASAGAAAAGAGESGQASPAAAAAQATSHVWPFSGRNTTEGHEGATIYFTCTHIKWGKSSQDPAQIGVVYELHKPEWKRRGYFEKSILFPLPSPAHFSHIQTDDQGNPLKFTTAFQTALANFVKADCFKTDVVVTNDAAPASASASAAGAGAGSQTTPAAAASTAPQAPPAPGMSNVPRAILPPPRRVLQPNVLIK